MMLRRIHLRKFFREFPIFFFISVWFEPTEVRKARKLLDVLENWNLTEVESREYLKSLRYISPNVRELISIAGVEDKM